MMITTTSTEGGALFHSDCFAPAFHPGAAASEATYQPPNPNSIHGLKRLASCREELERSWLGGTRSDLHCVSSSSSSCGEDSLEESNRRVKRRRTLQTNNSNDEMMVMDCSLVRGVRISPSNRPPRPQPHVQSLARPQVKAGWYEGEVDALGNRQGKGTTKHDDGTEYEGPYLQDVMEGPDGRYKFITTKHLVPNPYQNGSNLYRQIERSFQGSFKNDMPHGKGLVVTKTVDSAPQALGSTPIDVRLMEVVYDVGMHSSERHGKAVGEGVRIIYSTTNADDRSTLEMNCFRLFNGESTDVHLAPSYAKWVFQCMDMDFPVPMSSM